MFNPFIVITGLTLAVCVYAATPTVNSNAKTTAKTAQSQAMSTREVETTRLIREKITDAENLSIRARNVKIITENGRIYLKGPVASREEMDVVGRIAQQNAGDSKVINETYVEK